LFLAPRQLNRDLIDYAVPAWISTSEPDPVPPIVSDYPGPPATSVSTLNIDGGVTDNDPFGLAHDFLASRNPNAKNGQNPRAPLETNCAVITVAPFPSAERYDPTFNFAEAQGIFPMLRRLFTILVSQSRFLGESLAVLASGAAFSRFVIAPSDAYISESLTLFLALTNVRGVPYRLYSDPSPTPERVHNLLRRPAAVRDDKARRSGNQSTGKAAPLRSAAARDGSCFKTQRKPPGGAVLVRFNQ
jgi:hypothetical protein